MPFDSPDVNLGDLLKDVSTGKLQLPDFQREWKRDTDRIQSLLASISLGYPVGVLMTLEVGGDSVRFLPRPISGVKLTTSKAPEQLVLDGQQRLTSLYQSLYSGEPVNTKDPRGKRLVRWYYLDMDPCLDPEADREDAIIADRTRALLAKISSATGKALDAAPEMEGIESFEEEPVEADDDAVAALLSTAG